jgi:hypothetical protein
LKQSLPANIRLRYLKAIADAAHIQAIVMLDVELERISEANALGITEYRNVHKKTLKGEQAKVMPHSDPIYESMKNCSGSFALSQIKIVLTQKKASKSAVILV